jgi:hypothetical protein
MLSTNNVDITFKHYDRNDDFYQIVWKFRVIIFEEVLEKLIYS